MRRPDRCAWTARATSGRSCRGRRSRGEPWQWSRAVARWSPSAAWSATERSPGRWMSSTPPPASGRRARSFEAATRGPCGTSPCPRRCLLLPAEPPAAAHRGGAPGPQGHGHLRGLPTRSHGDARCPRPASREGLCLALDLVPDEMYFGTGGHVPHELASRRRAARAARLAATGRRPARPVDTLGRPADGQTRSEANTGRRRDLAEHGRASRTATLARGRRTRRWASAGRRPPGTRTTRAGARSSRRLAVPR
jgi:hypothetical protein